MRNAYAGRILVVVGAIAILAGGVGIAIRHTYFIGRTGRVVDLTASSDTAVFWFVVLLYLIGGAMIALYGRATLKDKELLP